MVARTAKQAKKKKHTEKQLSSYFQAAQEYSFLERKKKRIKTQDF